MSVQMEIPVELKIKVEESTFGIGPSCELPYMAISTEHNLCQVFHEIDNVDGSKSYSYPNDPYPFRETSNGIQYFNYGWKYFGKAAQEAYFEHMAEKELLED